MDVAPKRYGCLRTAYANRRPASSRPSAGFPSWLPARVVRAHAPRRVCATHCANVGPTRPPATTRPSRFARTPLLLAEFGVPCAVGSAHAGPLGYSIDNPFVAESAGCPVCRTGQLETGPAQRPDPDDRPGPGTGVAHPGVCGAPAAPGTCRGPAVDSRITSLGGANGAAGAAPVSSATQARPNPTKSMRTVVSAGVQ